MLLDQLRSGILAKLPIGVKQPALSGYETGLKVRLLPWDSRRPATAAESTVVNLLARGEDLPLETLLALVAEALYREELRAGAWAVDAGLFGSSLFVAEARRAVEAGDGELWQIG